MELVGAELVGAVLSMLFLGGWGAVLVRLRAHDRRAAARERALIAAVREEIRRASGLLAPAPHAITAPAGRELQRLPVTVLPSVDRHVGDSMRAPNTPSDWKEDSGAIINIGFSADVGYDSTGWLWLQHVMDASRRKSEPLDDDTPAPMAQRTPVLPPPSSSRMQRRR